MAGLNVDKKSNNFWFLQQHDPLFLQLALSAERAFNNDPNTTLIKLRQLGEAFAQHIAARVGVPFETYTTQRDLLNQIHRALRLDPKVREFFYVLRTEGNRATHEFHTHHKEAMLGLRIARQLAVWFHRAFGKQVDLFKPGPFIAPPDPSAELTNLQTQIEKLKGELQQANTNMDTSQQLTALLEQEKQEFEALAHAMDEESRAMAEKVTEQEAALQQQQGVYEAQLAALQAELNEHRERAGKEREAVKRSTRAASQLVSLTEAETRELIDLQLLDAGWDADSQHLTYAKGARPEPGRNKAIAEWPTNERGQRGRADYVLFCGLMPIAVVEAKKENINVAGKIPQAERYSRGFQLEDYMTAPWDTAGRTIAWADEQDGHYTIPFVYSCNGRPYVKQLFEQSGTWFRDVRAPSHVKRPLPNFHTPTGLLDTLRRSREAAEKKLQQEGFSYLKLRDYQENAIRAVEQALANNQRNCLLAMATGTGKTRTIIGLMYRFLKAERFKRILFLVDRSALGQQAIDAFNEAPLEQSHTLSTIYNVAELGDMASEAETRVQVATVQAMVKRVFMSDMPPPIDAFDCIIVDEAHRGYTLDQEMTEGELATRDVGQYLSSYRRVLDYFDAAKIGLTATPAKHTSEIFGKPVYTYTYREAVAEDWLIDHEPPIRYITLLSEQGISFDKGDTVSAINTQTGEVETAELDDELHFEVDTFNRRVISESFNQVICEQLALELDPLGDEKTMIFCATDLHADMVKRLLDNAFKDMYGDEYKQAAVRKITGQSDKVNQLIREYKNERYPTIAITVDLLTTGIDVPAICNLVFMRRVKSRILYEQMIGRATRRCDDIGKTVFRIYDPVDIYAALDSVNTMKPLVKDPKVTLDQLVSELTDPTTLQVALDHPGEHVGTSHADDLLNQVSQKVMRVLRKAEKQAETKPELEQKLQDLEALWGVEPKMLHKHLHDLGPQQAVDFIQQHSGLLNQLNDVTLLLGSERNPIISEHQDRVRERTQSYGEHRRPEDYLDAFNHFISEQLNASAALAVVVNKPKNLTREQLKEIKLLLDSQGYTEAKLQSAVRNQTNRDIAASIVGHIRRAALGEALEPFEDRVKRAMAVIYSQYAWTTPQRTWLERLAKQLVHEVIIDRDFVNERFADRGGANQLDKMLASRLDAVLEALNDSVWAQQAG